MITTYNSYKIPGRTAEHDPSGSTLTVWQGGTILISTEVPADATPGELWRLINADYAAPKKMEIGARHTYENYPLRGHAGRKSDWVTKYNRRINGKDFEFSKVVWADGGATLRVHAAGTTTLVHEIQY